MGLLSGTYFGFFSPHIAEEGTLDTNASLLRLNTVRFLIPVMDDESQLVHFLFSPMYNSSGRIKTANGPRFAQLCSVTAALLSNYFRKGDCFDFHID